MSSEWSGFTDEDLRRIRGQCSPDMQRPVSDENLPVLNASEEIFRKSEERKSASLKKPARKSRSGIFKVKSQNLNGIRELPLTPGQSLSHLQHSALIDSPNDNQMAATISEVSDIVCKNSDSYSDKTENTKDVVLSTSHSSNEEQVPTDCSPSDACTCISLQYEHELVPNSKSQEKDVLVRFEEKQKLMEAENAKRKQMLLEALDDRKKRTREEAKKIAKIQTELNKLDSLLSCDVGILRNQIEIASLEFTSAQWRNGLS